MTLIFIFFLRKEVKGFRPHQGFQQQLGFGYVLWALYLDRVQRLRRSGRQDANKICAQFDKDVLVLFPVLDGS